MEQVVHDSGLRTVVPHFLFLAAAGADSRPPGDRVQLDLDHAAPPRDGRHFVAVPVSQKIADLDLCQPLLPFLTETRNPEGRLAGMVLAGSIGVRRPDVKVTTLAPDRRHVGEAGQRKYRIRESFENRACER